MTKEEAWKLYNGTINTKEDFFAGFDAAKAEKPQPCIPDKPGWYWVINEGEIIQAACMVRAPVGNNCLYVHMLKDSFSLAWAIEAGYIFYPATPPWEE